MTAVICGMGSMTAVTVVSLGFGNKATKLVGKTDDILKPTYPVQYILCFDIFFSDVSLTQAYFILLL